MKYKYNYQFLSTSQNRIYLNLEINTYDVDAAIQEAGELTGNLVFRNKKNPRLITVVVKMNSRWVANGTPPSELVTYIKVQAALKALGA